MAGNKGLTLERIDDRQPVDLMFKHRIGVTVFNTFSTARKETSFGMSLFLRLFGCSNKTIGGDGTI